MRADSGFYAHALVVVCREMDVRFSITIRQHARLRELIEAIPEEDWTPVHWIDGGGDVAETTYRACPNKQSVMRNWKAREVDSHPLTYP